MIFLIDDGTLDTVFECSECGAEMRFSNAPRTPDGEPEPGFVAEMEAFHDDEECAPERVYRIGVTHGAFRGWTAPIEPEHAATRLAASLANFGMDAEQASALALRWASETEPGVYNVARRELRPSERVDAARFAEVNIEVRRAE